MWAFGRRQAYLPCSAAAAALFSWGGSDGWRLRSSTSAESVRSRFVRCEASGTAPTLSVGCYNVLCSTYAVKWNEREGIGPDGASNWAARWPAMRDVIQKAHWDVVTLQEVEHTDVDEINTGLGDGYVSHYFKHKKRPPDGVLISVRKDACEATSLVPGEVQWTNSVAFGRVDFVHKASGQKVRVVTAHMRGGKAEQLKALVDFADDGNEADVTVITADFNEDFGFGKGEFRCPFPDGPLGVWTTLQRDSSLPAVSRPPHKQGPDQKSGKGKIDWIFVRGKPGSCKTSLVHDDASRTAILESHARCAATGQWPSDHGCEALSICMLAQKRKNWSTLWGLWS